MIDTQEVCKWIQEVPYDEGMAVSFLHKNIISSERHLLPEHLRMSEMDVRQESLVHSASETSSCFFF